jgi:1,4-dihydroxy-2-naphthoyl-CoA hydrolase
VPDDPLAPLPLEQTMDGLLGLEILSVAGDVARGRFEVTDRVRQPLGMVHGGAYAALAEGLSSVATWAAVRDENKIAIGQSNYSSFMRPVFSGTVHAEARARHRGRTSWVWEVEFTDDDGRLSALTRVTVAVRPVERS